MYLIEYSVNEKAFHIEPMTDRLHKNIQLAKRGITKDYQAVGFATTREQADKLVKDISLIIKMDVELYVN